MIAGRTTLTYDLVGRRLTQQTPTTLSQFAYDASDALTTLTSNGNQTIYGYDNNGNRTNRSGPAGFFAYSWDDQDRLVEVASPTAGTFTMGYGYDGLRLWQQNGDGSRSSYVYDGDEVLSWQKGALSQVLVWGEGMIRSIGTTTMGTAQDRIFHADAQGTTAATTTGSQAIETGYQTDAWGNTLAGSASDNPYIYGGGEGYWQEPSLGLTYVGARWLEPQTGTWLSVDPVVGEPNYSYAYNAPTAYTDPSGMQAQDGVTAEAKQALDRFRHGQLDDGIASALIKFEPDFQPGFLTRAEYTRLKVYRDAREGQQSSGGGRSPGVPLPSRPGKQNGRAHSPSSRIIPSPSHPSAAQIIQRMQQEIGSGHDPDLDTGSIDVGAAVGEGAKTLATGVVMTAAGALVVATLPEDALLLGIAAIIAGIGSFANSFYQRTLEAQRAGIQTSWYTRAEVAGGDQIGVNKIGAGVLNASVLTGEPLNLSPTQRGQAIGGGVGEAGTLLFGPLAAGGAVRGANSLAVRAIVRSDVAVSNEIAGIAGKSIYGPIQEGRSLTPGISQAELEAGYLAKYPGYDKNFPNSSWYLKPRGTAATLGRRWLNAQDIVLQYRGQAQQIEDILSGVAQKSKTAYIGRKESMRLEADALKAGETRMSLFKANQMSHGMPNPLAELGIPTSTIPGVSSQFAQLEEYGGLTPTSNIVAILIKANDPRLLRVYWSESQFLPENEAFILHYVARKEVFLKFSAHEVIPLQVDRDIPVRLHPYPVQYQQFYWPF